MRACLCVFVCVCVCISGLSVWVALIHRRRFDLCCVGVNVSVSLSLSRLISRTKAKTRSDPIRSRSPFPFVRFVSGTYVISFSLTLLPGIINLPADPRDINSGLQIHTQQRDWEGDREKAREIEKESRNTCSWSCRQLFLTIFPIKIMRLIWSCN